VPERRPSPYGIELRRLLANGRVSAAARALAAINGKKPDSARRYIQKILSGEVQWPATEGRDKITAALTAMGVDPESLPTPDEAEQIRADQADVLTRLIAIEARLSALEDE
jgi:hypothetical protein